MSDLVFSILTLMWTPFCYSELPILVVPYGFGVVVAVFALVKRLGGFDRV